MKSSWIAADFKKHDDKRSHRDEKNNQLNGEDELADELEGTFYSTEAVGSAPLDEDAVDDDDHEKDKWDEEDDAGIDDTKIGSLEHKEKNVPVKNSQDDQD